jgi:hypothetical protein
MGELRRFFSAQPRIWECGLEEGIWPRQTCIDFFREAPNRQACVSTAWVPYPVPQRDDFVLPTGIRIGLPDPHHQPYLK